MTTSTDAALDALADTMLLGPLLDALGAHYGGYKLLEHWTQGEFHHDIVVEVAEPAPSLPGSILVVSTNCNGGVKEVLCFAQIPERWALWNHRCPDVDAFSGELTPILGRARTRHWFEPCELLVEDARSELKPEYRQRQRGGGWTLKVPDAE